MNSLPPAIQDLWEKLANCYWLRFSKEVDVSQIYEHLQSVCGNDLKQQELDKLLDDVSKLNLLEINNHMYFTDSAILNNYHFSLMHLASALNHEPTLARFIKIGSFLEALTSNGETPLLIAVKYFAPFSANILIKSGAVIEVVDSQQEGVIHAIVKAKEYYHNDRLRLRFINQLVDCGADLNIKSASGETPLDAAETNKLSAYFMGAMKDLGARHSS